MKEYKFFLIDITDGVALVTINNPKALNALSSPVVNEMIEVVTELSAMKEVRCVVLTGAGEKSFVAGADIKEMYEMDPAAGKAYGILGSKAFQMIENMPQPVIAAVNGFALGGGCELAMACDIRVAADTAVFGQPECGLGILPGFGGTQRLPRLIGKGRAKELIFTCDRIDAQEAYRIGLANKVVPKEELLAACQAMARKILSKGSYAVTLAKACVESGMDMDIENGLRMEATTFGMSFATHDKAEGMQAFLEKRPAQFTD